MKVPLDTGRIRREGNFSNESKHRTKYSVQLGAYSRARHAGRRASGTDAMGMNETPTADWIARRFPIGIVIRSGCFLLLGMI